MAYPGRPPVPYGGPYGHPPYGRQPYRPPAPHQQQRPAVRFTGRMTWVATPPPGIRRRRPARRALPYLGPPAYPAPPRWGFPRLSWRRPSSVPGTTFRVQRTPEGLAKAARAAQVTLWAVAGAALIAAVGEIWRYVLLVLGRDEALPGGVVAVSDALVLTGSILAMVAGLVALGLALRWLLAARELAAGQTGTAPARPDWQVLVGVLVPGLNLVLAGSVLGELEHAATETPLNTPPGLTAPPSGSPGESQPRPSRLVLAWWAAWVVGEVLAILTLLLGLRTGIQARADGVLWHAVTDLAGTGTAVLTVLVITAITGLVGPVGFGASREIRELRGLLPVKVTDAPEPPLRTGRPAGSAR